MFVMLRRAALVGFRHAPPLVRRWVVRRITPSFTVGSVLVLRDGDEVLLLDQRHHDGLTLPGGLLRRGEDGASGLRREVWEEVGLELTLDEPSVTVVDSRARRVDLVFTARLVGDRSAVRPDRQEVISVVWQRPNDIADTTEETQGVLRRVGGAGRGGEGVARPA